MSQSSESTAFREGMSRLGAAITVLTSDGPAGRHGMTASAVVSVTDNPPTLIVCVNRQNRSHDLFVENGVVAVNVLGGRHRDLSGAFAGRGAEDRFAGHDWKVLSTGAPVLGDAEVAFDCRIADVREVGSHSVLTCAVQAVSLSPDRPESLIWFGRGFHHLHAAE
ncbi:MULTISPECIES: flavin reductase family protein [Paracoccus]|jgi:flavin reductase|uniref:Flavin reductase n=1 Tax=Paracoccus litorisediminis TaxID=2006130 RepID=A0A844HPR7_9RHOB|nr:MULTISPECIES: flavin reductase family protein [Paracoccus]MBD9527711.1 flavin reductase [Paracoccus sp. PAR01]MTH60347.1 flavin reductase [Paracoccus litorisediminis]